jgi:hypothetical protein
LRDNKLVVKLFLRHPLHAKLYLLFRDDFNNPITGYLGSSNLTFAGLSHQGELNIDVLDHDACQKLAKWFDKLWGNKFCLDISAELIQVIEESWAGEPGYTPYEIYLKMAYHLAQEARAGVSEFVLPTEFEQKLFPFQKEAVKIAARYLNRRGGVLIGDVVGLGKTFMATALARVFEDDTGVSTLIICPKNLVKMWQGYVHEYGLRGKVVSSSMVVKELPEIPARFRQVVIDESHNFRNREGKRYRAIQEYIGQSDSRCILVTATPYNKSYLDLSAQLRLFLPDDHQLNIRPEHLLREINEADLQTPLNTIAAFEKSDYADDWRELMPPVPGSADAVIYQDVLCRKGCRWTLLSALCGWLAGLFPGTQAAYADVSYQAAAPICKIVLGASRRDHQCPKIAALWAGQLSQRQR